MPPKRPSPSRPVLVVDDDIEALQEMSEALRNYGLTVYSASNGAQALLLAGDHQPAFVLMDYNLPGANGLETASSIREVLPDTTVILMSAVDDFCRLATTKSTGTFAILKKPLAINSIARFIRNTFEPGTSDLDVTDMLTA